MGRVVVIHTCSSRQARPTRTALRYMSYLSQAASASTLSQVHCKVISSALLYREAVLAWSAEQAHIPALLLTTAGV